MSQSKILKGVKKIKKWRLKSVIQIHNFSKLFFNSTKLAGIPYPKNAEKTHTLITGASD